MATLVARLSLFLIPVFVQPPRAGAAPSLDLVALGHLQVAASASVIDLDNPAVNDTLTRYN
jgi:hypothetical protein